jgi:SRSO17 transposase
VRFGCALADAGYGASAPFRAGLSARGLRWAVGVPRTLKVYPAGVALRPPPAGSRRKLHEPDRLSRPAEQVLADAAWRRVTWRRGTKGRLSARFAAARIRVADGPPQQIGGRPAQHLPGEEAWVVGERRASGETKYYLSNLPADAPLETLAATIKARWACEQAHQQLKEELGLGHFEGRSWTGLHRHALMAMLAYTFLQHRRLAAAKRGKKARRTSASTEPARRSGRHHRRAAPRALATALPTLRQVDQRAACLPPAEIALGGPPLFGARHREPPSRPIPEGFGEKRRGKCQTAPLPHVWFHLAGYGCPFARSAWRRSGTASTTLSGTAASTCATG